MIRKAIKEDIPYIINLLIEINRLHHRYRPDTFSDSIPKYNEEELLELINNPDYFINVYIDDYVVGYTISKIKHNNAHSLKPKKTYWIDDFCVDPKFRSRGIGKELYEYSKDQAKSLVCDSIELNVWSFNENAIKFYEMLGLTPKSYIMEDKLK